MKCDPEERCVALGNYIIETGETVRNAAAVFGISKSTVHKDVTVRLKKADRQLWLQTAKVLQHNKEERHLRGGMATRHKYHPEQDDAAT